MKRLSSDHFFWFSIARIISTIILAVIVVALGVTLSEKYFGNGGALLFCTVVVAVIAVVSHIVLQKDNAMKTAEEVAERLNR